MLAAVRKLASLVPVQFGIGGRAEEWALRILDPFFSGERSGGIRTSGGVIELDMSQAPQRFLAYCYYNLRRHYANSALGQHIRQCEPGRTFVDVGANLGFYSLLARERGMNVAAFEPEPALAEFLQRNERVFGTVFPVALGARNENLPLYVWPGNFGAASLVPQEGCRIHDRSVAVRTFSELALDGHLGDPAAIDLVKIDVEGAEESTVEGMTDFLAAGHRPEIWCEVRGRHTPRGIGSFSSVREILEPFGFAMLDAPETGEPGPIPDDEVLASRGIFDVLFRNRSEVVR